MKSRIYNLVRHLLSICLLSLLGVSMQLSADGLTSDAAWAYNAMPIWQKKTEEERRQSPRFSLDQLQAEIAKINQDHGITSLVTIVDETGITWRFNHEGRELEEVAHYDVANDVSSVSNVIVGLAVMRLVEQGDVKLTDSLAELAPELKFINPWETSHPIRLMDLLEDTAGWDGIHFAEQFRHVNQSTDLLVLLNDYPSSRISRWPPGTRRSAGSIGLVVAAYIVEKRSGQEFLNFFNKTITEKTGIQNFTVDYHVDKFSDQLVRYPFFGGIQSSVNNMSALTRLLVQKGRVGMHQIFKPSSIARLEVSRATLGSANGDVATNGAFNVSGYESYAVPFYGKRGEALELSYSPVLKQGFYIYTDTPGKSVKAISRSVKKYLLRDYKGVDEAPQLLPAQYSHLSGYYKQISGYNHRTQFFMDIVGINKIKFVDDRIRRIPLLGDHPTSEYYVGSEYLVNAWRGLPVMKFVEDPIAGEVLQAVHTYKKVSPLSVYARLLLITSVSLCSIAAIIYAVVYLFWCLEGVRIAKSTLLINIMPGISSLMLVGAVLITVSDLTAYDLGRPSMSSLGLFVLTGLYGVFAIVSLLLSVNGLFKCRFIGEKPVFIVTVVHMLFVLYLFRYDLIFVETWLI